MSDALGTAINGLNLTGSRIAKAASSIVKDSSTGAAGDLTTELVGLAADKTAYAAEAQTVRTVARTGKTLVDILA